MPRQTSTDTPGGEVTFTCDACDRSEQRRVKVILGSVDDSARVAGWIIGPGGKPVWCPECTGKNDEYWRDWGQMGDPELALYFAGGES
jgi:hypothetical protein